MKVDKKRLLPFVESFNKRYGCQFDIEAYEDTLIKVMEEAAKEKAPENETSEKIDKIYKDTFTELYKQIIQNANEGKIARPKGYAVLVHFEQELIYPLINLRTINRYKTLGNPMGGIKPSERNKFIADIEATVAIVEQQPEEFDLNKLTPAVEKFNKTYGCKFNANKYVAELDKFKEDLNSERRDNLYREVFRNLYNEALKSMNSKKIDAFDAEDILYDFEDDIISPLFEMREKSGIKEDTQEYGGITYQERNDFFATHKNQVSKLISQTAPKRGNKEYDINKFQNAVNEFNTTYGCQLDIQKYANALKQFGNDETPERINQAYKDIFAEVNKQALRSALEGKIKFNSSVSMLNEFENNIIAPLHRESGYDNFAQPYGGMSEYEQLQLMDKCIKEVPSNLTSQILEQYENGKIDIKQMYQFAEKIFDEPNSVDQDTKKRFMACILVLEKSYNNRENKNSKIAQEELNHIKIFNHNFTHYFGESQYDLFRFTTSNTFAPVSNAESEIGRGLNEHRKSDPQWIKAQQEFEAKMKAERKAKEEAKAKAEAEMKARHKTGQKAQKEKLPPPTDTIMERYTEGRFPLRKMRELTNNITNNPTRATEEDRTRLAACISAIEQIHSTRSTAWMFRHPMRYYSEYRDARDMKAAFIKAFGEKQFDISTMCADCGCTEKQYENFQKAQEAAKNEMQMPKEVMHFRLEEINEKAPDAVSEPIEDIDPPAKNGREIN